VFLAANERFVRSHFAGGKKKIENAIPEKAPADPKQPRKLLAFNSLLVMWLLTPLPVAR